MNRREFIIGSPFQFALPLGLAGQTGGAPSEVIESARQEAIDPSAQKPPSSIVRTSDYEKLQQALDAVPAQGGLVELPPGTFELEKPLVISSENLLVRGSGPSTHLINRNRSGRPAILVRHRERADNPRARIWRIELTGLRLTGNPESGDGILAEGVNEIYIHRVSVERNGGHGISLVDCYENPRVIGSSMTYNGGTGLNIVRSHDLVVSTNQFEENLHAVRCVDSFNLTLTGNNLDDHLSDGIVIENTYGSVISGNMIEECAGWAMVLDRDCYGITIGSNVIAHNLFGIDLRDAWGSSISANTFTIVPRQAIRVGPESGRLTITGNNFSNSYIGGKTKREPDPAAQWPRISQASGVLLQGTSDITIVGNTFAGLVTEAVKAEAGCRRLLITGNNFVAPENAAISPFDLGDAQEVLLENNQLP